VFSAGNRREHGPFVGGETPVTGRFRRIVLFSIARSQRTARNGERDAGWRLRAPLHYTTIHTLVCGCRLHPLRMDVAERLSPVRTVGRRREEVLRGRESTARREVSRTGRPREWSVRPVSRAAGLWPGATPRPQIGSERPATDRTVCVGFQETASAAARVCDGREEMPVHLDIGAVVVAP